MVERVDLSESSAWSNEINTLNLERLDTCPVRLSRKYSELSESDEGVVSSLH